MPILLPALILIAPLTCCSTINSTCPCYPPAPESTKEILRQYQDKNRYPDTWAWFNDLARLRMQLNDCKEMGEK